jgi:CzcA family heavy metal efflux pump
MLRWVLGFSLQYRFLVIASAAALMFLGAYRLRDAPVDALPEFAATVVEVQTEALGLSAEEVEDLITLNTEELLANTPWVKSIRSKSVPGLSSVLLVFEPGIDLMRARQVVQERLIGAYALPNISKRPIMLQPVSVASRAMIVGLSSKDVSLVDMSVLARWTITPKLLGVPGVANVTVWGDRARQLQVRVDSRRLRERGVTLGEVIKTTGEAMWVSPLSFLEASVPGAGGWIDTPNQRLGVQHKQPISTAGELAKVAIAGTSLRLGDLAQVVEDHQPLIGDAVIGDGSGLLLVVEKLPHANTFAVVEGINAAFNEMQQGMQGIKIDTSIFRATSFIDLAIDNLRMALLIGAVLLAVVLFVLYSNWRATVISIVTIPLSLVTAAFVLYLRKTTIDAMVLAGLAIALPAVIDDAVVDIENILRRLRRHHSEGRDKSTAEIVFEAGLETRSPVIYGTLIAILTVLPLFVVGGPLGKFLSPLATSYVLALLASVVVAMTVTPVLAFMLLHGASPENRELPLRQWLQDGYEKLLARCVGAGVRTIAIAGIATLIGFAVLPLLSWSLLPSFKERDVQINWTAAPGTSHPEMQRIVTRVSTELRRIPGVRGVAAHIGRAVTGDQVVGVESAQIWVSIDAKAGYDATLASIQETAHGYPGLAAVVKTYLTDKVNEGLTEAGDTLVVRVQGPEREVLRQETQKVARTLSGIPGIVNLHVEGEVQSPQVEIEVDLAAAGQVGLKPGDVRRAAATYFGGLTVGYLFEQQKVFDVVVWSPAESRRSVTDLSELLIDAPGGRHVRLADVAAVRVNEAPAVIEREAVSRRLDIRADVSGRDVASVVQDINGKLQKAEFPLEYHAVLLRNYSERQAAHWLTLIAALAAAIAIYFLVQACFRSWRLAFVAYLTVLAALVGGMLAIFAAGSTVLLGSLAGLLAVLSVAARYSILTINRFQLLELQEGEAFGPGLVLRGARERFGPILTSAIGIGVAVLPFLVFGNIAGLEILHPMAVVVLGGLVTAAIVNLFVVPALYLSFASPRPQTHADGGEQYAT